MASGFVCFEVAGQEGFSAEYHLRVWFAVAAVAAVVEVAVIKVVAAEAAAAVVVRKLCKSLGTSLGKGSS